MKTMGEQINIWTPQANALGAQASVDAATAQAAAQNLVGMQAALAAQAEIYDGEASYTYPQVVVGSDGATYRCMGTGVTGVDPVGDDGTNWKNIAGAYQVVSDTTISTAVAYVDVELVAGKTNEIFMYNVYHDGGTSTNNGLRTAMYSNAVQQSKPINVNYGYGSGSSSYFNASYMQTRSELFGNNIDYVQGADYYGLTNRIEIRPDGLMSAVAWHANSSSTYGSRIEAAGVLDGIDMLKFYFQSYNIAGGRIIHAAR